MPSRKKAKGQARKAAKARNEAAEKARKLEEAYREFEQMQIKRLQVDDQRSVLPICMHGFDPFPDDDICIKFIRAFVREFYKWLRKMYEAGRKDERGLMISLSKARDSTKDEYSEVWNSSAKMRQVIKYFFHNGTMLILDGDDIDARHSALFARFFEEWLKVEVHKSQSFIDWPKVIESCESDEHTLVKYFWRRIRCSCLDEKYEEVKSRTKMGVCFNLDCAYGNRDRLVERSELRCCSRCRSVTYCSRECQAADWSVHKELCDEVAAERAEFDANHQQQP